MAGSPSLTSLTRQFMGILLLLVVSYGCASGGGTEGTWGRTISGVLLTSDGQPQEGTEVQLLETGAKTTTNASGFFELERVELPEVPINLQLSDANLNAVVTLEESLPQQEVSVAVSIKVQTQSTARIDSVVVIAATPTPQPTAAPTGVPPTATNAPTATPIPGAPSPTPTSTPTAPLQNTPRATPTITPTPVPTQQPCVGDVDGNRVIDLSDLALVLGHQAPNQQDPNYLASCDLDIDGDVDGDDVDIVLAGFGTSCP